MDAGGFSLLAVFVLVCCSLWHLLRGEYKASAGIAILLAALLWCIFR